MLAADYEDMRDIQAEWFECVQIGYDLNEKCDACTYRLRYTIQCSCKYVIEDQDMILETYSTIRRWKILGSFGDGNGKSRYWMW